MGETSSEDVIVAGEDEEEEGKVKIVKYAELTEEEMDETDRDALQYEITMLEEALQSIVFHP